MQPLTCLFIGLDRESHTFSIEGAYKKSAIRTFLLERSTTLRVLLLSFSFSRSTNASRSLMSLTRDSSFHLPRDFSLLIEDGPDSSPLSSERAVRIRMCLFFLSGPYVRKYHQFSHKVRKYCIQQTTQFHIC